MAGTSSSLIRDLKIEEPATKDSLGHNVILAGIYHAPPGPPSTYNGDIDEISDLKSWKAGDRPKRRSVHRRSDACLEALLSLLARDKTERLSLKGFPLNNHADQISRDLDDALLAFVIKS